MIALVPDGSTPPGVASVRSDDDDDLLLEHLAALVREIDEVPQRVKAQARATFRRRAEVSQPRRRGGAGSGPGRPDLAQLDLHTV